MCNTSLCLQTFVTCIVCNTLLCLQTFVTCTVCNTPLCLQTFVMHCVQHTTMSSDIRNMHCVQHITCLQTFVHCVQHTTMSSDIRNMHCVQHTTMSSEGTKLFQLGHLFHHVFFPSFGHHFHFRQYTYLSCNNAFEASGCVPFLSLGILIDLDDW